MIDPSSRFPSEGTLGFTSEERALIRDTHFFQAKAIISKKVKETLEALHEALKEELAISNLLAPEGADIAVGQFVKGEHLLDFPYQYLDLPKYFTQAEKFTFRSLFWWGHHFIFAWILEGEGLGRYKENLLKNYESLADRGLYLLLAPTPWEWRKRPEYLLEIRMENKEAVASMLAAAPFLKIERFIDFDDPLFETGGLADEGRAIFRLMKPIVAI